MGAHLSTEEVIALLRRKCDAAGGQTAFAKLHGISAPYISDVLNGRRDPGDKVLEAIGLERAVTYVVRS